MDKINRSLGEELKGARNRSKYSLREVEEMTGISNAYLSQLENNKIKKPSANILYKLANVYLIGFDMLMETAQIVQRMPPETSTSRPKTLAGYSLYSKDLTKEEEEALADYLEFLRFKNKDAKR